MLATTIRDMSNSNEEQRVSLDDAQPGDQLVARRAAELFTSRGIGERDQAAALSEVLGIGTRQARRKIRGEATWSADEIIRLARHLDTPIGQLFGPEESVRPAHRAGPGVANAIASELAAVEPGIGLAAVRALFERHGVARHKQAIVIATALEVSATDAYHMLRDERAWSLGAIDKLARHFGESLGDAVSHGVSDSSCGGVVFIGQTRVPCRIWLDDQARQARAGALVADRDPLNGEWVVGVQSRKGPLQGKLIRRLAVQPPETVWRVAVLDDHGPSADALTAALKEAGFDAEAFYTDASLRAAIGQEGFDAYLLDWILGSSSARSLVAHIRESDIACPIGILTGEIGTGRVVEAEMRDAVRDFDLQFVIDKPYRAMLVAAQLNQALSSR